MLIEMNYERFMSKDPNAKKNQDYGPDMFAKFVKMEEIDKLNIELNEQKEYMQRMKRELDDLRKMVIDMERIQEEEKKKWNEGKQNQESPLKQPRIDIMVESDSFTEELCYSQCSKNSKSDLIDKDSANDKETVLRSRSNSLN